MTRKAAWFQSICLLVWIGPYDACALDPQALFADERAALGGAAWHHVSLIQIKGKIIVAGSPGDFHQTIDHQTGHSVLVTDTGSLHDISGFDGAIWDKQNGIVTAADLPSLLADAETQAFVYRDGWWNQSDPSEIKLLPASAEAGVTIDRVQVTPAKGSPVDVWFDHTSHLIIRTVAHTEDGEQTTVYSEWRQVGGVKLPFHEVLTDSTGASTTLEVTSVAIDATLNPELLARPLAEPHGSLLKASSVTTPFVLTGDVAGHIVVAAMVNGSPSNLLFDSGAANYFAPEAAHRLGLATSGGLNIGGVGSGNTTGGFAHVGEISIAGVKLQDEAVMVGPLPYIAIHPRAGISTDGLAGFEFLSEFRTTVDYAKRTLTFSRFQDAPEPGGVTVPFLSDGHDIYLEATIDGATGLFRLDTGDASTVTVFRTFADEHHIFKPGEL